MGGAIAPPAPPPPPPPPGYATVFTVLELVKKLPTLTSSCLQGMVWNGMEDNFSIFHTGNFLPFHTEVESSRTDFEVLGLGLEGQVLGLEASSPRKLACPRLEDSTIFWNVKILWSG